MSQSEIDRFTRDLRATAGLLAEVRKVGRLPDVVALAGQRGYGFTADELAATVQERAKAAGRKLSAADLDAVAGAGCRNAGAIIHGIFGGKERDGP